jgi:hypothetical protein
MRQLLNIALRGATAAMQLSHREGFEVKVSTHAAAMHFVKQFSSSSSLVTL